MQIRTHLLSALPKADGLEDGTALAIEHYVASTSSVLTRVLRDCCRSFAEPRASPPPAARYIGHLVETLLGIATGAVLGQVLGVLRRMFGGAVSDRLSQALRDALSELTFSRAAHSRSAIQPVLLVLDPIPRPLVDELWVRLHERLASARASHRDLLTQVVAAIPADRASELASVFKWLVRDTTLAAVWSRHLELSWRFYSLAACEGTTAEPALPSGLAAGSAADTWRAWLRRVRGEREPTCSEAREAIAAVLL